MIESKNPFFQFSAKLLNKAKRDFLLHKRKIYLRENYAVILLLSGLLLTVLISINIHALIDKELYSYLRGKSSDLNYALFKPYHQNQLEPRVLYEKGSNNTPDYGGLLIDPVENLNVKSKTRDYGGLLIDPVEKWNAGRIIEDSSHLTSHVWDSKDGVDDIDYYYAFDDDYVRHPSCRRVSWHRLNNPNCNIIHENPLFDSRIISHGYYRDVLKLTDEVIGGVIFKTLRFKHKFNTDSYENIRVDALVMERLTSSPRIADMFGHCGTTIIQEIFVRDIEDIVVPGSGMILGDEKLNDTEGVQPRNDFTPTFKLQIALQVARAIADLHGFPDGVIVHDDIQICQFLYNSKGILKLSDFNRAEVMLWDNKNQKYCKYNNGKVYGNFRAVEEFKDDPLDEKIDVWSFGNMVYGLLTGLWVFYDTEDDEAVQKKVIKGETAFIDSRYKNRSFAEAILVQVIENCWIYNSDERTNIFEIVEYLKNAVIKNAQGMNKTKSK